MANKGRIQPGQVLNPKGRPKGAKNKITKDVAGGFLDAWQQMGSVEHLARWGKENPDAFYALLGKLLPKEVKQSGESTHTHTHKYRGIQELVDLAQDATRPRNEVILPVSGTD